MKIITFVVPCYNSANYMKKCINTLLKGGNDVEIILVNDGSIDETPAICDEYAKNNVGIVNVIHQANGGHGEGINQGILNASGLYFKVVDSDDWLDEEAMHKMLNQLRAFHNEKSEVDLLICNYVYENETSKTSKVMRYTNVLPQNRIFTWEDCGRFNASQYILMHSVIYKTQLIRECNLVLPKHTFYVDNIFVYVPFPFVNSIYYMNVDLYRYFIGRVDQSVNENIMIKRVSQQIFVTNLMLEANDLDSIKQIKPKLAKYMTNYIIMMISISSILLLLGKNSQNDKMHSNFWLNIKRNYTYIYTQIRYRSVFFVASFKGKFSRYFAILIYKVARKIYGFN